MRNTILVTGGAGYIGSHNVLALLNKGFDVVIFDSLELGHQEIVEVLCEQKTAGQVVDFIKGNLQNFDEIASVFTKHKIDAVIHFAAYSLVEESVKDPQKYYFNNVYGTMNLLKAMLHNNVNKIVFSSTCATYGEPDYIPIDENHPQKPINPYGKSKLMVETIMDDYSRAYGLKSVRLRYFNVAGADSNARIGEWHNTETHVIPNVLKASLIGNKVFKLYGTDYNTKDGTCIRDYINVEDLAEAHIEALNYLLNGGETDFFNIGTEKGDSVKDVFDTCEKVTSKKIPLEKHPRRPGDPEKLVADSSKARNALNWTAKKTLLDSIFSAYQWEKTLQEKYLK